MKQQIVGDKLFEMVREANQAERTAVVYIPSPFYPPGAGHARIGTEEALIALRGNGNEFTVEVYSDHEFYTTFYVEGIAKVAEFLPGYADRFAARFAGG